MLIFKKFYINNPFVTYFSSDLDDYTNFIAFI